MTSLAEIRARIQAQENKTTNTTTTQSDNAIYPHWNIDEGTTATIRFLPDADPNNGFFWVERQVIKLPFNGIKGDPNAKQVLVQVPCVEMYGENCPVLAEVRPWYKDETLKDLANKYWKKRTYIFQGFVRQNPLADDEAPENPIRRFIISPQIMPLIKNGLMDPEIEEIPTHYTRGLDFNIRKTAKPGSKYADYTTSSYARKESALTEAEQAAIDAHGLYNLADFLPNKPSEAELRIIKEMFEASVDGRPYDLDKWGAYYRPYGVQAPATTSASTQPAPSVAPAPQPSSSLAPEPVQSYDDAPFETDAPSTVATTTSDKAADILAMIKARQNKPA